MVRRLDWHVVEGNDEASIIIDAKLRDVPNIRAASQRISHTSCPCCGTRKRLGLKCSLESAEQRFHLGNGQFRLLGDPNVKIRLEHRQRSCPQWWQPIGYTGIIQSAAQHKLHGVETFGLRKDAPHGAEQLWLRGRLHL